MTEVCRYQSICKEFEGRDRISSLHSTAWIVNWFCMVMLFIGLVILERQMTANMIAGAKERDILADALKVSPKDVLPHVLNIEQAVKGCALQTARQ